MELEEKFFCRVPVRDYQFTRQFDLDLGPEGMKKLIDNQNLRPPGAQ